MRKSLFFLLLFINFKFCYPYEVVLRKIELINLSPSYEGFIKDFLLQNFDNIELIPLDKNLEKHKYILNVKIGMLSNSLNSCVEIYPRNENYSYINCVTSLSFEEIPESLISLTKDILKLKDKRSRGKINLLIYTNSNDKFSGIFLLTDKMEVILYDKKVSKSKPNGNILKIYPKEVKYNLFYLDEKNSLKIVKLIFNGVKIENIYLMEREK